MLLKKKAKKWAIEVSKPGYILYKYPSGEKELVYIEGPKYYEDEHEERHTQLFIKGVSTKFHSNVTIALNLGTKLRVEDITRASERDIQKYKNKLNKTRRRK